MTTLTCIFFLIVNMTNTVDVLQLRNLYYQAYENEAASDEFFKVMKRMENTSDPLMLGYQGMSHLLQAKFSYNPYIKLASFRKGKELLDRAAALAPRDLEIRFLRFSVQTNAPKFLGYTGHIESDKALILKAWKTSTDSDLKKRVKEFMLKSNYCTYNERSAFER